MNWLITGGCGFIGTNLIHYLLEKEDAVAVRVVDNLSASSREDLERVCDFSEPTAGGVSPMCSGNGVELIVGDIRDASLALEVAQGADVIVHLAACTGVLPSVENPRIDCETNVMGVFNYLEAARAADCNSFILASSGAPLGEQAPPIHEEKVPRPLSPYGASKLCGEAYCHAYHGSFGLSTVMLRFGNVYGPRSMHKQSVVAKFIKLAMEGRPLVIYGEGSQTRDFVYIDDLVRAIRKAAAAEIGGEVFQIATNRETTVSELAVELAKVIAQRTGVEVRIEHSSPMKGEVQRNFSDVSKAKRLLEWEPLVDLQEGLTKTTDWFLSELRDKGTGGDE